MSTKITRKQQARNIIEWLDRLRNFKKTTGLLGETTTLNIKTGRANWQYCCLGVACRIQKFNDIDFGLGTEDRLVDTLCLRGDNAEFDKKVFVDFPELFRKDSETAGRFKVSSLVNSNDDVFDDDKGFARQRAFMLLTTNRWIKNKKVLEEVNRHFATERKQLATTVKFKIRTS